MLDAHYNGKINIEDYWAVGDSRSIPIGKINNSGYDKLGNQVPEWVIIDFAHDDLVSPINNINKAAITIQTKNSLDQPVPLTYSKFRCSYRTTDMPDLLNNTFKQALPSDMVNLIKKVVKKSNIINRDKGDNGTIYQVDTDDSEEYIFLISAAEINGQFGGGICDGDIIQGEYKPDGIQYSYYGTVMNRIKKGKNIRDNGYYVNGHWLRTGSYYSGDNNDYDMYYLDNNDVSVKYIDARLFNMGIAPAFCL